MPQDCHTVNPTLTHSQPVQPNPPVLALLEQKVRQPSYKSATVDYHVVGSSHCLVCCFLALYSVNLFMFLCF